MKMNEFITQGDVDAMIGRVVKVSVCPDGTADRLPEVPQGVHPNPKFDITLLRPTPGQRSRAAHEAGYLALTGSERPHVGHHPAFIGYDCVRCSRRIYEGDQCLPLITKEGTNVICDACMLDAIVPLQRDPALPPGRVAEAVESMQKILCDSN